MKNKTKQQPKNKQTKQNNYTPQTAANEKKKNG